MKKLFLSLLVMMLVCLASFAGAEDMRAILNPNDCSLIEVIDTWIEDDTDAFIVQGSFGDYIVELGPLGFADEDAYPLVLNPNAVIGLPDENGSNAPATIDDLTAFVDAMRGSDGLISFFCEFEMNEQGELTSLIYYSMPDEDEDEGSSAPAVYDPGDYTLLKVIDAWFIDDDGEYVVQGSFGEIDYTEEDDPIFYGFDDEDIVLLVILPDAQVELIDENLDNVPATVDDLIAYVQAEVEELGLCSFYSEFELNEAGALTKLTYCYFPY